MAPDELHGWGYAIALGIAALAWAGWAVMVRTGYGKRGSGPRPR